MMRKFAAFAALVIFWAIPSSYAQTITGSIVGTVVDPSALPVPAAAVTLVHVATGTARSVNTGDLGTFVFSSLQPGEYKLTVSLSGFKKTEKANIVLTASERLSVGDIQLEMGNVADTIVVTAQGAAVQTATAERSGVVTNDQVRDLLIRGRNVLDLLQLQPGVVNLSTYESINRNWMLYVQGNRRETSNVSLDGMVMSPLGNNRDLVVSVSQDAVAEVKVLLSNYQAEFGRLSGANISIVTKSGSRDFHGIGSYFKRHEQFNANNFFNNRLGKEKPSYRYNTWSYNVGGPVFIPGKFNRNRDKLFFFWSQEYWPVRSYLPIAQLTVPTELERAGDFSQSLDLNNKLIVVTDPTSRQPFPGNRIPANRVDPNGQALLKVFPTPNFLDRGISGGRYNYVFQSEKTTPTRMETVRLDYNINSNNMLFGNFSQHSDVQTGYLNLASSGSTNWPQLKKTYAYLGQVYVGRYTRIISPTLINELNVGYSRRPEGDTFDEQDLRRNQTDLVGFNTGQFYPQNNPLKILPNATFGGVNSPANLYVASRFGATLNTVSVTDTLTKTTGAHTLKAGFTTDRSRYWNRNIGGVDNGSYDFGRNVSNPLDTGYAYANAAAGVFNSYQESNALGVLRLRQNNLEWFVQDNWKATRRLTLDYGMRFYYIKPLFSVDDLFSGFVPGRFDPARAVRLIEPRMVDGKRMGVNPNTGQVLPPALIGAIAPGAGDPANGMVVTAQNPGYPRSLIDNRGVHFAPRFGFAFDPTGKGKTVVRGGFGVFYNRRGMSLELMYFGSQPPIVQTPVVTYGTLPTLLSTSGLLSPQNVRGEDRAGHLPVVMNYSVSVQRDVGFGTIVDLGYVGSLGRHLVWQRNYNAIPFGANFNPANADPTTGNVMPQAFLRPYVGYGDINMYEAAGNSSYHSLQATVSRRFARGFQYGASWTWSKALTYNEYDANPVSALVSPKVWDYGLATFDRTHVLKVNWLWDVPKAPVRNPVVSMVLNGWQVSGIASFVSGAPLGVSFSTTKSMDITGTPSHGARIVVLDNPVLPKSDRTFEHNFRNDVFALPDKGTFGNSARTILRGPGLNNWDAALFKNFPIRESVFLQFRMELYNAFNHTQFTGLDTAARFDEFGKQVNTRLGEFTSAANPRQMQFALRLHF